MLKKFKSIRKDKEYSIPIVDNLSISTKRINDDRKAFYVIRSKIKPLQGVIQKQSDFREFDDDYQLIRFEPKKGFNSVITRQLLKKTDKTQLSKVLFWDFEENFKAIPLDIVATALTVSDDSFVESDKEVRKIRKFLRRHRKKLGLVNMNTNITTSETPLGHFIKVLNFGLNDNKGMSRSQRKKANRRERERRKLDKEYYSQRAAKSIQNASENAVKQEKRRGLFVERQQLKILNKQEREAALFLKTLKKIQKYYPNEDEHLDVLFKVLIYGSKV